MVSLIDIILIIFLAGFIFYGFFFGLIRTVGSLAGVIVGLWGASHYYLPFYEWSENIFLGHPIIGKIISFLILFGAIKTAVSFLFSILDKTFNLLSIIPFLKLFNRIGGAILGFLEGSLLLGVILLVATRYNIFSGLINNLLVGSKIAPIVNKVAGLVVPLIPELLDKVRGMV
jgi:membrane protein required for colicin V production